MDNGHMNLEDAQALTSPRGQALLASLPPYAEANVVSLTAALRKDGHDPALIAAALTQSRLRSKAHDKFGSTAQRMLFTPDALEQATRSVIATRHARRFIECGSTEIFDGGCGIGADALGFAQAGLDVVAVESEPATAILARHNLQVLSPSGRDTRVIEGMLGDIAPTLPASPQSAWWFDPARRTSGIADIHGKTKRTFSLAALSPGWSLIQELAGTTRAAGVKLSPSLAHSDIPTDCEAEFTSYAGSVLESTLWWGDAATHRGPTATVLRPYRHDGEANIEALHITPADAAGAEVVPATRAQVGPYLYEADKALTRSGLVGALQNAVNGRELTSGFGYVTAESLTNVGLLGRRYRVIDLLPLHTKTLRSYLRERDIGRLTIKKRDLDLDADRLRRELKLKGRSELTLLLSHLEGGRVALVVEEIPRDL